MTAKKCLILNDREPIPEDHLDDVAGLETSWYQKTGAAFSLDEAFANHPDTRIIVTTYMDLNAGQLRKLPALEAVIATTISTHFIDSGYCRDHGIQIFNTENYTGTSVAEHAVALMMAGIRKIPAIDREVRHGNADCFEFPGIELAGKTAGIIGFGNIGAHVAQLLGGFNMALQFYNRSPKTSATAKSVGFNALIETSDILFLTLPLNRDSHRMINAEVLKRMKKSAFLVNTSPDDVMDLPAVKTALEQGGIGGAALDLLNARIFLDTPNTVLTSRRAWYTHECFARRIGLWKNTLIAYLNGQSLKNQNAVDFVPL